MRRGELDLPSEVCKRERDVEPSGVFEHDSVSALGSGEVSFECRAVDADRLVVFVPDAFDLHTPHALNIRVSDDGTRRAGCVKECARTAQRRVGKSPAQFNGFLPIEYLLGVGRLDTEEYIASIHRIIIPGIALMVAIRMLSAPPEWPR